MPTYRFICNVTGMLLREASGGTVMEAGGDLVAAWQEVPQLTPGAPGMEVRTVLYVAVAEDEEPVPPVVTMDCFLAPAPAPPEPEQIIFPRCSERL